jgi:hypothetical protein
MVVLKNHFSPRLIHKAIMPCRYPPRAALRGAIYITWALILLPGCAGPRKNPPAVDSAKLSTRGFQSYLANVKLVTVDEAYRAMLILADGKENYKTFEERRAQLEERGIAQRAWNLKPENVIDSGSVACMVCRICKIHGGVNMHLLGSWGFGDRRYATRELIYREMLEDCSDYQYMTGPDLFALMRKADALMEERGLYENKGIDLSDKKDRDKEGNLIVPPPAKK